MKMSRTTSNRKYLSSSNPRFKKSASNLPSSECINFWLIHRLIFIWVVRSRVLPQKSLLLGKFSLRKLQKSLPQAQLRLSTLKQPQGKIWAWIRNQMYLHCTCLRSLKNYQSKITRQLSKYKLKMVCFEMASLAKIILKNLWGRSKILCYSHSIQHLYLWGSSRLNLPTYLSELSQMFHSRNSIYHYMPPQTINRHSLSAIITCRLCQMLKIY